VPEVARRAGWVHAPQGGPGKPVACCHVLVGAKHWVYPPLEGSPWARPVELAFGPLQIQAGTMGCDLRPIDPRHPGASSVAACLPHR
jgi:hypothetical protein